MKNKILKYSMVAFLPLALSLAVCAGADVKVEAEASPVIERAITPAAGQEIYLDGGSSLWDQANAKFAIYAYGGSSAAVWSDFMVKGTAGEADQISGVYKVTMDLTDRTHIIFARLSSTCTTPSFDKSVLWNQTGDLAIADIGDNDVFKITDWSAGEWHKSSVLSSDTIDVNLNISAANIAVDGGLPYAYAFGAASYTKGTMAWPGIAMSNVSGDLYTVAVSSSYGKIIFNNNVTEGGRQTEDLTIGDFARKLVSGYDVSYKVTSFETKYVGVWDQSGEITNTFPTFTNAYMRLWLNRNDISADADSFYTVHIWNSEANVDVEIMPRGYQNFSNGGSWYFAYFDVPLAYVGYNLQFKVYANATGVYSDIATSDTATYTDGDNAMIYKMYNNAGVYSFVREVIGATANDVPAAAYQHVFEGYFSCSDNKNNGYGNFGQVSTTWIKNGETVYVVGGIDALKDVSLDDFNSAEDYATGANRTHATSIFNKYNEMAILYNATSDGKLNPIVFAANGSIEGLNTTNYSSIISVVIIAIVAMNILGVSVILIASKKRKSASK